MYAAAYGNRKNRGLKASRRKTHTANTTQLPCEFSIALAVRYVIRLWCSSDAAVCYR